MHNSNPIADLATATPREIDTRLAYLYGQAAQLKADRDHAATLAHRALEEKPMRVAGQRKSTWPTDDDDAVIACAALVRDGFQQKSWLPDPADVVKRYDAAETALELVAAEMATLNAEFVGRRGWSRFFQVTSSAGHVHSSMECSTCYLSTEYGWLPEWSGQSEDEALAALHKGAHMMCSVCFPNAPVAYYTRREPTADEARASGKCHNTVPTWPDGRAWTAKWAKCGECGAPDVSVTNAGNLRQHEHAQWRIERDRKDRLDPDTDLIGMPETGDPLRVDGNDIRTVRTAQIAYTDCMVYVAWGYKGRDYRADALLLAKALAFKKRISVEAFEASMEKKVAAKARR